jgi:hypothetical protein
MGLRRAELMRLGKSQKVAQARVFTRFSFVLFGSSGRTRTYNPSVNSRKYLRYKSYVFYENLAFPLFPL